MNSFSFNESFLVVFFFCCSYQFIWNVDPSKMETFNSYWQRKCVDSVDLTENINDMHSVKSVSYLFHKMLSVRDDIWIRRKLNEKQMRTFEWWKFDCDRKRNPSSLHFSNGIRMLVLTFCHVLEMYWDELNGRHASTATIWQCALRFSHVCRIFHQHQVKNVNARILLTFQRSKPSSSNFSCACIEFFIQFALNY